MSQPVREISPTEVAPDPKKAVEVTQEREITWDTVGKLFDILYEHDTATMEKTAGQFGQIAKEDTLDFKGDAEAIDFPDGTKGHRFEYAEHRYLGDSMLLPGHSAGDPGRNSAFFNPLVLDNGLKLTYGEINGLAGDFFGALSPISQGTSPAARKEIFKTAFGFLATSPTGKKKAEGLQKALAAEIADVNKAITQYKGHSEEMNKKVQEVYSKLPFDLKLFDGITKQNQAGPIYTDLLKANLDHFAEWGRLAYNAGHACALDEAAKGGKDNLLRAYAMNAFADHFLEDNFSAGHLRVPRDHTITTSTSKLGLLGNLSANVMHEEDGASGLNVESPNGKKWTAYGDARLFQPQEEDMDRRFDIENGKQVNLQQCRDALRQSIKEVYDAFTNKAIGVRESQYGAWKFAPDLTKIAALNPGHLPLLFVKEKKLYYRLGGLTSTLSVCVDDRYALTEASLWAAFYTENIAFVVEKIRKLLGI